MQELGFSNWPASPLPFSGLHAHRTCRSTEYMPSSVFRFTSMLPSTFAFRLRVSSCPRGVLLSSSPVFHGYFICTDTAHTGDPVFGSLPSHSQPQERLPNGLDTHQVLGEPLLEADLCCQRQGPHAGLFPREAWRLVQHGTQRFACGLIKLGRDCLWSGRLLLEASDAFLLKGMERIAYGLRGTAEIRCNDFGTLSTTGG